MIISHLPSKIQFLFGIFCSQSKPRIGVKAGGNHTLHQFFNFWGQFAWKSIMFTKTKIVNNDMGSNLLAQLHTFVITQKLTPL